MDIHNVLLAEQEVRTGLARLDAGTLNPNDEMAYIPPATEVDPSSYGPVFKPIVVAKAEQGAKFSSTDRESVEIFNRSFGTGYAVSEASSVSSDPTEGTLLWPPADLEDEIGDDGLNPDMFAAFVKAAKPLLDAQAKDREASMDPHTYCGEKSLGVAGDAAILEDGLVDKVVGHRKVRSVVSLDALREAEADVDAQDLFDYGTTARDLRE